VARFHLGTQSWQFRAWIGPFYPPNTPAADMLRWYGRMFSSIEVDSSFYAIPAEPVLREWRERVPDDFVFALKLPQQITHSKRLADTADEVQHFVDRVRVLEGTLGPVLAQLPPDFLPSPENRSRLDEFLDSLPEDVRWAVEFRHSGWLDDQTIAALQRRNAALTLADGRWVRRSRMLELAATPTADFCYVRWMGTDRRITDFSRPQVDRDAELTAWAEALRSQPKTVKTVYGYFNNHFQGHSPHSVREMQRLVGQEPVEPVAVHPQTELW
jgi:uncharacterized protein YecE (DUF72 family)